MGVKDSIDHNRLRTALADWLAEKLGDRVDVTDLRTPTASGFSSETVLLTARVEDGEPRSMVVRLEPSEAGAYPEYDIGKQYRIMDALRRHSSVPVPRLVGFETDASRLGTPFFVMEGVDGRVPRDDPPFPVSGWVLDDLDDDARARMYDNGLAALAAVHSADVAEMDLAFLIRSEISSDPLEQQVRYYQTFYEWAAEGETHATVEAAFDWVGTERPTAAEPTALSWGDARMGNMIFGPDMSVRAVLDWEMAWIASPEVDLGWWVFFDRYYTAGLGVPAPGGFPERARTMERYEELTGHRPAHVDFYEAFAGLRGAVIAIRLARLLKDAGVLPEDSDMARTNPAIVTMAALMELPPPAARASSFISKKGG